MISILLGPPGSGKGTQAKKVWKELGRPQLSTGDMLRTAIQEGSTLGKQAKSFMDSGALVPDSLVIDLIRERSQAQDCAGGFFLDGFPRNITQAEALDQMLKEQGKSVARVVLFEIPDDEIIDRISGRRTCTQCGSMYHLTSMPSRRDGVCDQCGQSLIQRSDDMPEVVQKRLAVYHDQTEPLVGFYNKQNKLRTLDARKSADEVTQSLLKALK